MAIEGVTELFPRYLSLGIEAELAVRTRLRMYGQEDIRGTVFYPPRETRISRMFNDSPQILIGDNYTAGTVQNFHSTRLFTKRLNLFR